MMVLNHVLKLNPEEQYTDVDLFPHKDYWKYVVDGIQLQVICSNCLNELKKTLGIVLEPKKLFQFVLQQLQFVCSLSLQTQDYMYIY